MNYLTVALVGHPNSGKTTLFNRLTGLRQQVGHWPGVTVECHEGQFRTAQYQVNLLDLPGTYSLVTPCSQVALDEQVTCRYLCSGKADLVINVVDVSDLHRHLYLTVQLLEQGLPCVIVLNRLDKVIAYQALAHSKQLAEQLGVAVIPIVATQGRGLHPLYQAIDEHRSAIKPFLIPYPQVIEQKITQITQQFLPNDSPARARWLVLKRLEGEQQCGDSYLSAALQEAQVAIQQEQGEEAALLIVDARYQTISALCHNGSPKAQERYTQRIDQWVLSRWLGIPLFLLIMYGLFFFSIRLGSALQPLFEAVADILFIQGTAWLGQHLGFPQGLLMLLAQGIGGGLNTLLPLIPPVGLLFLGLGLLEESGYMARAAFVMDRVMRSLGLPGKAFVPLIISFGCNVPAVLGTRTLPGERDRLLTILLIPFMACSARLAIFVVFSAAFFGQYGVLPLFSLYLLGIIVAIATGQLLKRQLLPGAAAPFIMELPHYQWPTFRVIGLQLWQRLKGFIIRGGKVIILVNFVLISLQMRTITGSLFDRQQPVSALVVISQRLTPLFRPLGIRDDNWPATVGLVTGAIAKEVVLGTLDTLYAFETQKYEDMVPASFEPWVAIKKSLQQTKQRLLILLGRKSAADPSHHSHEVELGMSSHSLSQLADKFGTPAAAYSYLIFVLLYIPCISTLGAIKREIGSRWMCFSLLWGINMAYSLSTLCYQMMTFSQQPRQSSLTIMLVIGLNSLLWVGLSRSPWASRCRKERLINAMHPSEDSW
ncbi:MAG: Fe(2+) transporter permease subunit FeoB [Candidatus Symbiodolus clandestinus]